MAPAAQLGRLLSPVVDMIYPPRCPACGAAIANQAGLCLECWRALEMPERAEHTKHGVNIHAATSYNETSRKLVLAYKHGGRITLGPLLAQLIAARMPVRSPGQELPVLVPVPLHYWRLWSRGFNQAAVLARELARLGQGEADVNALIRHRRTPPLGGLGRDARDQAMSGAIRVNRRRISHLTGRNVVLVDDVFTSGATTRSCIAALAEAQPASITIACFARVVEGHLSPLP